MAKQRQIPPQWDKIARLVVFEDMDFKAAGLEAGYKSSYITGKAYQKIKQDPRYEALVTKYQNKAKASSEITLQMVQNNAKLCLEQCISEDGNVLDKASYLKANEQLGRTITAFSDKRVTEDSDEIKELREKEAIEAEELAIIRLREVS